MIASIREFHTHTKQQATLQFHIRILILKFLDSKLEDKNSAPNDSKHSRRQHILD